MRYFERLRRSLSKTSLSQNYTQDEDGFWVRNNRPDNGRCGRQPQYGARCPDMIGSFYYCTEHYLKERTEMIGWGYEFYDLADGETMGCDYEVTV